MLDAISENPQREGLDRCERLVSRRAVGHGPGQVDDVGQPAAVLFAFQLNVQGYGAPVLRICVV